MSTEQEKEFEPGIAPKAKKKKKKSKKKSKTTADVATGVGPSTPGKPPGVTAGADDQQAVEMSDQSDVPVEEEKATEAAIEETKTPEQNKPADALSERVDSEAESVPQPMESATNNHITRSVLSEGRGLRQCFIILLFLGLGGLMLGAGIGVGYAIFSESSSNEEVPSALPSNKNEPTRVPIRQDVPSLAPATLPPCNQDAACDFVLGAIDPVFPPSTRDRLLQAGTCQNEALNFMRQGKDVLEMQVERIRQRYAMAMFYCELGGDSWTSNTELWVSDVHECDWYTMIGVDPCSRSETYQSIRNPSENLKGTLPPELAMIPSLWELTLDDNHIVGSIPSDYAKLSALDTLSLAANDLTGPLPDFVFALEDLVYLDLANNSLSGTLPNNVSLTAPNLRQLFLEHNKIVGTIPTDFGQLDWKRLSLSNNSLMGTIPTDIHAPHLEELYLDNNRLSGTFPAADFIADATSSLLTIVTLFDNNLQGNLNVMCDLFTLGSLQTLAVDLDQMACDCCPSGLL